MGDRGGLPALAGVDRSGRGFNPRPAQGGDSTSPPLRGWIVPVGGSTPDRLRRGTLLPRPCGGGSFRSGMQSLTGTGGGLHFSAPAGVDRSGRGFNPRPAQGGTPLPRPCGGGSFRSGVQPPTGTGGGLHFSAPAGVDRSGRGFNPRPAQGGTLLLRPCGGGSFRSGMQSPTGSGGGTPLLRPCGGGSFRSGVQPPTGTKSGGNPRPAQSSGSRSRFKVPAQGLGSKAGLGAV